MSSWGSVATVLHHPWQKYFWRLSIVWKFLFFFFFWITLQHAFHGRTHVYTESKTAELQPYIPKACIAKPLGPQSCVKHNKQWANSSLSPRLNFFISAFKCITRGSKWCPVFQVASPSIHWGCNQETSELPAREQVLSGTAVQKHMELLTTYSQWKIAFLPHLY